MNFFCKLTFGGGVTDLLTPSDISFFNINVDLFYLLVAILGSYLVGYFDISDLAPPILASGILYSLDSNLSILSGFSKCFYIKSAILSLYS